MAIWAEFISYMFSRKPEVINEREAIMKNDEIGFCDKRQIVRVEYSRRENL